MSKIQSTIEWNRFKSNHNKKFMFCRKYKKVRPLGRTIYRKVAFNPESPPSTGNHKEWSNLWHKAVEKIADQIKIRLLGKVKKCSMLWSEGELEVQGIDGDYHYAKTGGDVVYSIKGEIYCGFSGDAKRLNEFLTDFNMQKALLL